MRVHDALAKVDIFSTLPSDIIDEIVQRGTTHKVGPAKVLVQQGATDSGLQLIVTGSATVSVNGVEKATIGEGAYYGEMSLLDSAPRSATVVAGPEGATTFSVSPLAFSGLLDAHPEISRGLLTVLVARIRSIESASARMLDD